MKKFVSEDNFLSEISKKNCYTTRKILSHKIISKFKKPFFINLRKNSKIKKHFLKNIRKNFLIHLYLRYYFLKRK